MCCCLQVSNTCSHMSGSWELQIEHVMDGNKIGPKNNCLRVLPMYWLSLNLKRHVIWESVIFDWFQKDVDMSLSMLGSFVHF
jgi:hypothetical protein